MADNNRIGSACWYRPVDAKPGYDIGKWRGGHLRAWSTDFEELSDGVALFPVAVIEDDKTGLCHSIYVTRVCFNSVPPGEHV